MRIHKLQDGSIVFPTGSQPPDFISGYDQDPSNPYHFIPKFCPCKYRELNKEIKIPCSRPPYFTFKRENWCNKLSLIITPDYCNQCTVPNKI